MKESSTFFGIKEESRREKVDFQKECLKMFLGKKISANSICFLLLQLVKMYRNQAIGINTVVKMLEKGFKYILSEKNFLDALESYWLGLHSTRETQYNVLSFFISICMQNVGGLPEKTMEVTFEKKEFVLRKVLPHLKKRSKEEKELYYIPAYVLDMLAECTWGREEEFLREKENTIREIKSMEVPIKNLTFMKKSLEKIFKNLKQIIYTAVEIGGIESIGLLSEEARKVCEVEEVSEEERKALCILSQLLCEEIRQEVFRYFSELTVFFDPSSPRLASTLIVKTKDFSLEDNERRKIEAKMDEVYFEIFGCMQYSNVLASSIFFEIGCGAQNISSHAWNALGKVFRLELVQCQINFVYTPFPYVFSVLEEFFCSSTAQTIIHLSFCPLAVLSRPLTEILSKSLSLESLSLFEPSIGGESSSKAILSFFHLLSRSTSFFQYLKYFTLAFSYSEQTFLSIGQHVYSHLEKLDIRFLETSSSSAAERRINQLISIINRNIFPKVKEISLHNSNLCKYEFKKIVETMSMVQAKYRNFYCPMGSSYIKQKTYIFTFPESMSLNAGVVFIIEESVVAKWIATPGSLVPRQCLLCKKPFADTNAKKTLILPCGNIFHMDCMFWRSSSRRHPCCPLCRRKMHIYKGFVMAVYTEYHQKAADIYESLFFSGKKNDLNLFSIND